MKKPITLEFLSAIQGHAEIYFKDTEQAERTKLAEQIKTLIQNGHAVFLVQGNETRQVKDYDPASNEWIVVATPQEVPQAISCRGRYRTRVSAYSTYATVVPPSAGG